MALKKLSIVLVVILLLCVILSGCTPTCVIDESEMMQDVNIIEFAATSRIIEHDEAKRAMFALEHFEDNNSGKIYMILQSYYGGQGTKFSYIPDVYYFYDHENKGMDSEAFGKFKALNHWNDAEKVADEFIVKSTFNEISSKDEAIGKYKAEQSSKFEYVDKLKCAMAKNEIFDDFKFVGIIYDCYHRTISGIKLSPETLGEPSKLYALCFQANNGVDTYNYLADVYFKEIRLDHYAEDLEAFKKSNYWEEPLTVEDLNAMDKYVVSDVAK